jgi:3-deoxy-D-manno-octulosonate 8-phosphate phosphatase (KDO 8-P phosphatase)
MIAKDLQAKLAKIKVLLLDIDGVLTDGRILWIDGTGWTSFYSVKDGFGIKQLQRAGIEVGLISGGNFQSMRERAKSLGIKQVHLGDENKIVPYEKVKAELHLQDDEIAYMGDELFDLPLLLKVGFAATVPAAPAEVRSQVHYITKEQGGFGAVREIADFILQYSKHVTKK